MKLLSLSEALMINRRTQNSDGRKLQIHSNYLFTQGSIFLRAYLAEIGLSFEIIPETFNGMFQKLDEKASAHLILIDSDTLCVGQSLRCARRYMHGSDKTEFSEKAFLSGLDKFLENVKVPVVLALVDVRASSLRMAPSILKDEFDLALGRFQSALISRQQHFPQLRQVGDVFVTTEQDRLLTAGEFFSSERASLVANSFASALYWSLNERAPECEPAKLLITDLDDTLWGGILGEVGWQGLAVTESEAGTKHWIYQRFLQLLSEEGVLLAVSSKNELENASEALANLPLSLDRNRLSVIECGWDRKSQQIQRILKRVGVLPESTVFIDDNPTEIEEVSAAWPGIRAIQFPATLAELPAFLDAVRHHFRRLRPSTDIEKRIETIKLMPVEMHSNFTQELSMTLEILPCSQQQKDRSFELLNKTNQFNFSGQRMTRAEFDIAFSEGQILVVSLKDRLANWGLIAVIVRQKKEASHFVKQFVLSCRVFNRGIEDAVWSFLLNEAENASKAIEFVLADTGKNRLVLEFLKRAAPGLKFDGLSKVANVWSLTDWKSWKSEFQGQVAA